MDSFTEYQREAAVTIARADGKVMTTDDRLANFAMGVAGESGELVDHLKKHLYHGRTLDIDHVTKELGDILWYVSAIAKTLGIPLASVATLNIVKLRGRHRNGAFTPDYQSTEAG